MDNKELGNIQLKKLIKAEMEGKDITQRVLSAYLNNLISAGIKLKNVYPSQTYISKLLNEKIPNTRRKDLLQIQEYVRDCANEISKYNNNETFLIQNKVYSDDIRSRGNVEFFIKSQINKHRNSKSEFPLEIKAIGVKLSTLYRSLKDFLLDETLPEIDLKGVVLNPKGEGTKIRGIIERDITLPDSISKTLGKWHRFEKDISKSKVINNSTIKFRLLKPDPNAYIITIGEEMLFSPYLQIKGIHSHFDIVSKKNDKRKFIAYLELFNVYFNENTLSSDCDLKIYDLKSKSAK